MNARVRRCRRCLCTDADCEACVIRTGEPCHWVGDDLCSACVGLKLPETMTPSIAEVLGFADHRVRLLARLFRAAGVDVEEGQERAFIIWRFLPLALLHGAGWRDVAQADIAVQQTKAATRAAAQQGGASL